jgi:cytochrome b involved in lipid metabolism
MSSSTPAGTTQPTPNPPRNDPITTKELSLHNGQDPSKPIWVAVKGTVFDVSRNKDAYGNIPTSLHIRNSIILFLC